MSARRTGRLPPALSEDCWKVVRAGEDGIEQSGETRLEIFAAKGAQSRGALIVLLDHPSLAQDAEMVSERGFGYAQPE